MGRIAILEALSGSYIELAARERCFGRHPESLPRMLA
jgi:hypothetical protein